MPLACISHTRKVDAINYWPRYNIQGGQKINIKSKSNISVTHGCPYTILVMPQLHFPAPLYKSIHYAQDHNRAI